MTLLRMGTYLTTVRHPEHLGLNILISIAVDRILSEHLAVCVPGLNNPFREYVLPLAYQQQGILHALLGLSSCHMQNSGKYNYQGLVAISLGYRLSAIHSVSFLLLQEEVSSLTRTEEEYLLAMVLLLVLHDVCRCVFWAAWDSRLHRFRYANLVSLLTELISPACRSYANE